MSLFDVTYWVMFVIGICLGWFVYRPAIQRAANPRRETYDEMRARSARLDHELWPKERFTDHPRACPTCSAARAVSRASRALTSTHVGHDADYEMGDDVRLGTVTVHRQTGRLTFCRTCDQMSQGGPIRETNT